MTFFEHNYGDTTVYQIPVLTDNYIYVVVKENQALVIDPALAEPVEALAATKQFQIIAILNTHQHLDHVGGNEALVSHWDCPVYASAYDKNRIPKVTHSLNEGDTLNLIDLPIKIIETPGHTLGHIIYYFESKKWAFVGDTLFSLGCGRLFEGTPQQMHKSLEKIASLPLKTTIFCSHEYTEANLAFHNSVLGNDSLVKERSLEIQRLRQSGHPTVPMNLGLEIRTNLFLRSADSELRTSLGLKDAEPWEVFQKVRSLKDNF